MTILELYYSGQIDYWEAWKQLYNAGMREPATSWYLKRFKNKNT